MKALDQLVQGNSLIMIASIHQYSILILDFGSQYTQLMARRVRELGVYCQVLPWHVSEQQIKKFNPSGIILSGGPESTIQFNSPRAPEYIFKAGVPVLGICYGMQTMAIQLGGQVQSSNQREFGSSMVEVMVDNYLVRAIQDGISAQGNSLLKVWMSHGDKVTAIPKNFVISASTKHCPVAIMADESQHFYGVQFHPEVTHTIQGKRMIARFVLDICRCKSLWTPKQIIDDSLFRIRKKVGKDKVILGLSGGTDSLVTAMLLQRAIGDRLTCVFIDNGLLRLNEASQILKTFRNHYGLNIIHVSAEDRFFSALAGINEPEKKRKIIGKIFIEIFDEQALGLKDVKWLAQGTIYPDLIESASAYSSSSTINSTVHIIKSHHNVVGLPKEMKMGLIEPLRELFKDEVRNIGLELGLPYEILYRHPFPGPGLGVRVLGEVKKEYCDLLRRADAIFIEELRKANLYHQVSQAFTVFIPVRSVGVMGDCRKYDWVVSLRAVETIDFMTAQWAYLPHNFLDNVSNRIINEIDGISRVVYDISGKPPATIEWE